MLDVFHEVIINQTADPKNPILAFEFQLTSQVVSDEIKSKTTSGCGGRIVVRMTIGRSSQSRFPASNACDNKF
jgi:hypothetical protein